MLHPGFSPGVRGFFKNRISVIVLLPVVYKKKADEEVGGGGGQKRELGLLEIFLYLSACGNSGILFSCLNTGTAKRTIWTTWSETWATSMDGSR